MKLGAKLYTLFMIMLTTSLMLASESSKRIERIQKMLASNDHVIREQVTTAFFKAITAEDEQSVRDYIAAGVNVNRQNKAGFIPLLLPTSAAIERLLKDSGSSLFATAKNGDTALIVATRASQSEIVDNLLKNGLDPDQKNNKGESARSIAIARNDYDCVGLIDKYFPVKGIELVDIKIDEEGDESSGDEQAPIVNNSAKKKLRQQRKKAQQKAKKDAQKAANKAANEQRAQAKAHKKAEQQQQEQERQRAAQEAENNRLLLRQKAQQDYAANLTEDKKRLEKRDAQVKMSITAIVDSAYQQAQQRQKERDDVLAGEVVRTLVDRVVTAEENSLAAQKAAQDEERERKKELARKAAQEEQDKRTLLEITLHQAKAAVVATQFSNKKSNIKTGLRSTNSPRRVSFSPHNHYSPSPSSSSSSVVSSPMHSPSPQNLSAYRHGTSTQSPMMMPSEMHRMHPRPVVYVSAATQPVFKPIDSPVPMPINTMTHYAQQQYGSLSSAVSPAAMQHYSPVSHSPSVSYTPSPQRPATTDFTPPLTPQPVYARQPQTRVSVQNLSAKQPEKQALQLKKSDDRAIYVDQCESLEDALGEAVKVALKQSKIASTDSLQGIIKRVSEEWLVEAAQRGNQAEVEKCLANIENVDKTSQFNNKTALMMAAQKGCMDIVQLLLGHKATIDTKDETGKTAIDYARECQQRETVSYLENLQKEELFKAVQRGDVDAVKKILDAHPHYIDVQNEKGWTPLMQAIGLNHYEIAQRLVACKANPEIRSKDQTCSPRLLAAQQTETGDTRYIKLFRPAGSETTAVDILLETIDKMKQQLQDKSNSKRTGS